MTKTPADVLIDRISEGMARRDDLYGALLAAFPEMHHAQRLSILDNGTAALLKSGRVVVTDGVYGTGAK
jgi:hypothetical protein